MDLLEGIQQVALECGRRIFEATNQHISAREKSSFRDLVTRYDEEIQAYAVDALHKLFPEAGFIAEENGNGLSENAHIVFVIDPIDGTANFIHHFRHSCTSIACLVDGKPFAGAIFNPYRQELFSAQVNAGAWLNGMSIHVTSAPLIESLTLFGTSPYALEMRDDTLDRIRNIYAKCLDLRRLGSAALDLCDVAAGHAALYFEGQLSLWDYAAGMLIVKEAGGICLTYDGDEPPLINGRKSSIIAGTEQAIRASGFLPYLC